MFFNPARFVYKYSSEDFVLPPPPEINPTPFTTATEQGQEFTTQSGDMKYIKNGDCWECSSHAVNKHGYPVLSRNGKIGYAHRFSYQDTKGPIPDGNVLLHSCDNRKCINPSHLTAGTQLENIADRVAKGRSAKGIANGRAKLSETQVQEILADITTPKKALARKYQVDPKMIRNIKNRTNWSHIYNNIAPNTGEGKF
jgi:HNH endonuclease